MYYECSQDESIPNVIYRVLKNYYELLKAGTVKLFEWGKYRWYEGFIAINFSYERWGEEWLVDLAKILKAQGNDYETVTELWKRPLNKWTFDTHIVNLAMMLKSEAVSCTLLGEEYEDKAEYFHQLLKQYNGTPVGLYTGDKKWAERLEILAFNALPATISDDMWTHQYVQMSNQISCQRFSGKSVFRTNDSEAHLFGLEPNYGCCTANFNQGWSKLAFSAFMHRDDTIINVVPVPSHLTTEAAEIDVATDYPFENRRRLPSKSVFLSLQKDQMI